MRCAQSPAKSRMIAVWMVQGGTLKVYEEGVEVSAHGSYAPSDYIEAPWHGALHEALHRWHC